MGGRQLSGPIYSTRADDPAVSEAIDAFVIGVAERIDTFQDAESKGELTRLADLAKALAVEAEALGFDSLSRCAEVVEAVSLADDRKAAHKAVVDLTGIAQRIRLGHRGAA